MSSANVDRAAWPWDNPWWACKADTAVNIQIKQVKSDPRSNVMMLVLVKPISLVVSALVTAMC